MFPTLIRAHDCGTVTSGCKQLQAAAVVASGHSWALGWVRLVLLTIWFCAGKSREKVSFRKDWSCTCCAVICERRSLSESWFWSFETRAISNMWPRPAFEVGNEKLFKLPPSIPLARTPIPPCDVPLDIWNREGLGLTARGLSVQCYLSVTVNRANKQTEQLLNNYQSPKFSSSSKFWKVYCQIQLFTALMKSYESMTQNTIRLFVF